MKILAIIALIPAAVYAQQGVPTPDRIAHALKQYPETEREFYAKEWQFAFQKTTKQLQKIESQRRKDADACAKIHAELNQTQRQQEVIQRQSNGRFTVNYGQFAAAHAQADRQLNELIKLRDQQVKETIQLRENFLDNNPPYIPNIDTKDFHPDRVGVITTVRIIEIIDDKTVKGRKEKNIVIVRNAPTKDLKYGKVLPHQIVRVIEQQEDETWVLLVQNNNNAFEGLK